MPRASFTLLLVIWLAEAAWADFRYVTTIKGSSAKSGSITRHAIKGNKMKMDSGTTVLISDLDAGTITTLLPASKTYTVRPIGQAGDALPKAGVDLKVDLKDTGQQKKIGPYQCRLYVLTMTSTSQGGGMRMENEMWVSSDVPGAAEIKASFVKMADRGFFPGSGDPQTRKMMLDMQRQMAKLNGVTVLQVTRMKAGDDKQSKQLQVQMENLRAQMEALKKAGGKQAEMAEKALSSMGGAGRGNYLIELTTESSGFSSSPIPASEFAIPAGFKKVDR
jgi:hypothetical protein